MRVIAPKSSAVHQNPASNPRLSATIRLDSSRAESAHHKNDQADQQDETKASSANDGTTKVKTTAAEQESQNKD